MATLSDPSDTFLTMRTIGGLITVCKRYNTFYMRLKSKPTFPLSIQIENVTHCFFATLEQFKNLDAEQLALLEEEAEIYFCSAFTLLLSLNFKSFLSSWCGSCYSGSSSCGGQVA